MSLKDKLYKVQLALRQKALRHRYRAIRPRNYDSAAFEPNRVLFVLSGLIGDSVMSLPAIEAARKLWPGAKITVLGKRHNRDLIAGCGFFDDFYECNADPFSLRSSSEIKDLNKWLAGERFDAAFILLGDQFAHLLAKAKIPVRVGVKGTPLEKCLTHTYEIGSPRSWGANERLNSIRCLGYHVENEVPRLKVADDARVSAVEKLRGLGLNDGEKYIVVHPFGSTERQWWEIDKVLDLTAASDNRPGVRTVLVGGPETQGRITAPTQLIDATGNLSLKELIAALDSALLVVSTDSGPFHIAGALARPLVGLFRSRRPEHATQYPTASIVFGENAVCMSECEWDKCRTSPCRQMADISAESVIAAAAGRLDPL